MIYLLHLTLFVTKREVLIQTLVGLIYLLYLTDRHSCSTKILSYARRRPSMLIRIPALAKRPVKARLVNCAP
jgi:hypothetical protein